MPLLYERLRAHLLDEIRSGRLGPGDRIPSEYALAEQFSVSRITSKKALETLERDGLIVRFRGKGSFVAEGVGRVITPPASARPNGQLVDRAAMAAPSIGLVMPHWSDTYGSAMLMAVEERCAELGYALVVKRSHGRHEVEHNAISTLVKLGVRGLIVFPVHGEFYNDALLRIVLDGFPVVLVDRYLKGIAVNSIGTDNYQASRQLTTELLNRGHKHIAFASLPSERTSSIEDRRRGFAAALREHGLRFDRASQIDLESPLPVDLRESHIEKDRESVRRFLDANPQVSAFVACEYTIAVILEQVLTERGRQDMLSEVFCFDTVNYPLEPTRFTHILQDERGIGMMAVDILTGHAKSSRTSPRIDIPHKLVLKTAPPDQQSPTTTGSSISG